MATLPPEQVGPLSLGPLEEFDYAAYLRGNRERPPASEQERARAANLLAMFQDFQRASVLDFYTDVHARLEARVGRKVPFSCNNAEGFLLYLHQVHDFAVFEAYPDREGIPAFFYRERVLPFRQLGKPFVITFVSDDVQQTRRMIAQSYAFGSHTIAPWDVFTGADSPRVFGEPANSADLYGFVRANAKLFDGYEEAAVTGAGLVDARFEELPPIRLRGGTQQVVAVVRALPQQPQAAVVVHLVDWSTEPQPFSVVLDPRRFFGNRSLRVRLLTPGPYDAAVHDQAAETGNMQRLSVVKEYALGRQTDIELPALQPWGLLVVEPGVEQNNRELCAPMIWAQPASYYAERLNVQLDCPSPNTTLRFTLDGSEPLSSSPQYNGPLSLSEATVIRARAFAADGQAGPLSRAEFRPLGGRAEMIVPDAPSLHAHLRLWISADSLAGQHADGDFISQWPARVGPALKVSKVQLLNGDMATPPRFRSHRIHGRPVIEFSEPSHHLDIPRFGATHLAGKRFTIFMIARSSDAHFGFSGNALNGSGGVPRLYVTRGALHVDRLRGIPTGAPAGKASINTYMHDDGVLRTWVDGKPRGQREQKEPISAFGSGGHLAMPFWGASQFHGGEMAEIAVFDRALTEKERVGVETYLANKYGIHDHPKWR
jgi:hypothetical protein